MQQAQYPGSKIMVLNIFTLLFLFILAEDLQLFLATKLILL
jgi:hypothetical protein